LSSLGLAELVLIVEDVPAAARFYEEVVGLMPENEASDEWAWFWAGKEGAAQRVALHRGPLLFEEHSPYPEGERFGRVHFAFEVARDELDTAVDRVRKAGVDVHGPIEFEWMDADSYYFYDLDGNLLEFWSPSLARPMRPSSCADRSARTSG
jgi:catechol 2,3-dioxygenase-like lactoylglutathione lyase family enzyme